MSDSFVTPWTVACKAPLFMGFPRQEYWSGLPFPPSGDLPDPGIESSSPASAGIFFTTEPPGKPNSDDTSEELKALRYLLSPLGERLGRLHNCHFTTDRTIGIGPLPLMTFGNPKQMQSFTGESPDFS